MGTMQLDLALAGEKIVIAGLALQVFTFLVFLAAAADFQARMARKQRLTTTTTTTSTSASVPSAPHMASNWKKVLYILYSVSALILLRCTFRLIEYAMGNAAYLMAHEWTLYTFDALPMALVLVLLLVLRPSRYVEEGEKGGEESSDGEDRA